MISRVHEHRSERVDILSSIDIDWQTHNSTSKFGSMHERRREGCSFWCNKQWGFQQWNPILRYFCGAVHNYFLYINVANAFSAMVVFIILPKWSNLLSFNNSNYLFLTFNKADKFVRTQAFIYNTSLSSHKHLQNQQQWDGSCIERKETWN